MSLVVYIIASVIAAAALITVVVVYLRKLSVAAALDLEAMRAFREKSRRTALLEERLARKWASVWKVLMNMLLPIWKGLIGLIYRFVNYLKSLEQRYRQAQQEGRAADPIVQQQSLSTILEQAKQLVEQNKYVDAEQQYIAAIALDNKSVEAYRGLVSVCTALKNYPDATETLLFLQQLDPKNETIWQDLGELYRQQELLEEALDAYDEALLLNPNNPKNLDAVLKLAITNKLKYKSQSVLDRLKAVNPENQSLANYQAQIDAL